MQKSTNEYEAEPKKRRRGAPLGNSNALKSGRYTAARKDFRRRYRDLIKRANLAVAAGNALARAKDEDAYAEAYAKLLAAAAPKLVIPDGPQGRSGTHREAVPMGPGSSLRFGRDDNQDGACPAKPRRGVDGEGVGQKHPKTEKQFGAVE